MRRSEVFPNQNSLPQSPGVTFSPMPTPKPASGFIEIGEHDGSTYAFENSVELLAGSDGRVYAVPACFACSSETNLSMSSSSVIFVAHLRFTPLKPYHIAIPSIYLVV